MPSVRKLGRAGVGVLQHRIERLAPAAGLRRRRTPSKRATPEQTRRRRVSRPLSDHEQREIGHLDDLDDRAFDSYLLERAALERRLCSARLSPTLFIAGPAPDRVSEPGFLGTAATTTSKVARDLVADRRFRRAMLQEAGFRTGKARAARRYRAIATRTHLASLLLESDDGTRNVVDDVADAGLAEKLADVLAVFPGLAHAEIEFCLDDHTQDPAGQPFSITGMSVRPSLWPHEYSHAAEPGEVARRILAVVAPDLDSEGPTKLTAEVSLTTLGPADRRRLEHVELAAADLGLSLVEPVKAGDGDVTAVVYGEPCCVAAFVASAMSQLPSCESTEVRPLRSDSEHEEGADA